MLRTTLFVCFLMIAGFEGIRVSASKGEDDKLLELLGRYIGTSKSTQRVAASPPKEASPARDVRDDILFNLLRKLLTLGAGEHQRDFDRKARRGQPQLRWDFGTADPGNRATDTTPTHIESTLPPATTTTTTTAATIQTNAPSTPTNAPNKNNKIPKWAKHLPWHVIEMLRRMGAFDK